MNTELFFHGTEDAPNTLSEIRRIYTKVGATETFNLFAYATQSGLAAFDLKFGNDFWETTSTRWLFGIDYGRTQPIAIRNICEKPNTIVRLHDGEWLVGQKGFLPRRDFHAKISFLLRPDDNRIGVVTGSGNFSSNGLKKSIEAGASLHASCNAEQSRSFLQSFDLANSFWEQATPAETILEKYEERWSASFARQAESESGGEILGPQSLFWIETGYVTKNRGPLKPGNQIDLPRGMSHYFGFQTPPNLAPNSTIGEITFETPSGRLVTKNLRLGNNLMEKITLPVPEDHGFDIYDGKILIFRRTGDHIKLNALEAADFESTFGDKLSVVMAMSSGRRYGHIE